MKELVIINAEGFGEEVSEWVTELPGFQTEFKIKGFLDDRNIFGARFPILGNCNDYIPASDEEFICALSNPELKKKYIARLKEKNARFFSVVHPTNYISRNSRIGEGCILAPFNSISNNVMVGNFVTIYGFCKVGHDAKIMDYAHIDSHCSIDGFSTINNNGAAISSYKKILKDTIYE